MLKRDKNFKLPKPIKRMLAFMSKEDASIFKKAMIQGIIAGSIEPPREKKKNRNKQAETEE